MTSNLGDNIQQIFSSAKEKTATPTIDNNYSAIPPGEQIPAPIYTAPIDEYKNLAPRERIINLLTNTLNKLQIPDEIAADKILLHTVIPSLSSKRHKFFQHNFLTAIMKKINPRFAKMKIEFSDYSEGVSQQLKISTNRLINHEFDAIIFGGIDSLINPETVKELSIPQRLMTQTNPTGLAPGEAAAYLLIQTDNISKTGISAITSAPEPNINHADTKTLTGLIAAIKQINLPTTEIKHLITSLGAEANDPLEWYQITQSLWSNNKLPIPQEIFSHINLGEIGAATIPATLAIANHHLQIKKESSNFLICEANQFPQRGAILLTGEYNEQS